MRPLRQCAVSCSRSPVGAREQSLICVGRKPFMSPADDILISGCCASMRSNSGRQCASAQSQSDVKSEEHTSELQSLMRISYAVFCLKKKTKHHKTHTTHMNKS